MIVSVMNIDWAFYGFGRRGSILQDIAVKKKAYI